MNSAHIYVKDACGDTFLHTFMSSDESQLERQKAHCRWWINYAKRMSARGEYKDSRGNRLWAPVGRCEIVVEFYDDKSN